ncbi:MAG TPA: hypothetical protein DDY43_09890 [Synechococcales bacterium UBA10510]|nr:hypothetical protein [Synechococcales bacterium UBA10510]
MPSRIIWREPVSPSALNPQEPSGPWPGECWQYAVAIHSDALIPSQNHSAARTQIENSLTGQPRHPACS